MLAAVADLGVPRIHFGVGTGELLVDMRDAGADVVGVDFRVPLSEAARRVGDQHALQGNLDPAALFAGPDGRRGAGTRACSPTPSGLPGHIFNLGHGVLPDTDPDVLHARRRPRPRADRRLLRRGPSPGLVTGASAEG